MLAFLVCSMFPIFAIFLGITALTPAGIELGGGRKLPRMASIIVGISVILFSAATIAFLYAYCVLGMPLI